MVVSRRSVPVEILEMNNNDRVMVSIGVVRMICGYMGLDTDKIIAKAQRQKAIDETLEQRKK